MCWSYIAIVIEPAIFNENEEILIMQTGKEKVNVDEYEEQWDSKPEAEKTKYRVLRSLILP